jgi:hypothetical protein
MSRSKSFVPVFALLLGLAPCASNARSYTHLHDQALNYFAASATQSQVAANSKGRPGEREFAANSKGRPGEFSNHGAAPEEC